MLSLLVYSLEALYWVYMLTNFHLVTADSFIAELTKACTRAETRIFIMATILVDDEGTAALFNAIEDAAARGVNVNLAGDAFTYTELKTSYRPATPRAERTVAAKRLETRMKAAGAAFRWLGRFNSFAFVGRTHIKWYVVDDTVYSFGGINMDGESLAYVDYVFRTTNQALADRICDEQARILRADELGRALRSHTFGDDDTTVLVDSGLMFDSVIYRRACYWAARATSVTLVSQYCPTGKLSRLLKRIDSHLYFNHWTGAGFLNKWTIRVGMYFSRHTTSYHKRHYLHAKYIIFTLPSGDKVALTGSHNFVWAGVVVGTREVALETTNRAIITQLENYLETHVI